MYWYFCFRWEDIAKLGYLPELHTLILSDNPLLNIAPVDSFCLQSSTKDIKGQPGITGGEDDGMHLEENKSELGADAGQEHMQVTAEKCSEVDSATNTIPKNGEEVENESVKSNPEVPSVPGDSEKSDMADEDVKPNQDVQYDNETAAIHSGEGENRKLLEEGPVEEGKEEENQDRKGKVTFQSLSVLCVSNTKLGSWSDIDALRTFPKLTSVKIRVRISVNWSFIYFLFYIYARAPQLSAMNQAECMQLVNP